MPAFTDVQVATDERIWLRRWPRSGRKETPFDVLSAAGQYRCTVIVPLALERDVPPYITDRVIVGVIRDPNTDAQQVVAFRFDEPRC